MYLTYTVALALGLLVALPWYAVRFRKYMPGVGERLGLVPGTDGPRPVWIHAVSVGELHAVDPLIRALRQSRPAQPIVLSTTTPSGRALARRRADVDRVTYFPLDLPGIVKRTLDRLRPEMVIIAETEIWPNFLRQCARRGIAVLMVNGRISDRSFGKYRLARRWLRRVLPGYTLLGMQSETDAARILEMGAPPERVRVFGNVKYDGAVLDREAVDPELERALRGRGPLVIAASTARGEDAPLIEAFQLLRRRRTDARLLIAPRRAEQFDPVCRALESSGLRWHRRTGSDFPPDAFDVLVLDSFGELRSTFGFASAVFMGGTLVPRGGHNILEPARFGKPVLFGPHMHNFRDMAREFLEAGAAIQVHSAAELADGLARVLDDPETARRMGAAAEELIGRNLGATARILAAIAALPLPAGGVPE